MPWHPLNRWASTPEAHVLKSLTVPLVLSQRTSWPKSQSFKGTPWLQSQAGIPPLLPMLLTPKPLVNSFLEDSLSQWIPQCFPWKSGNRLSCYSVQLWRMTGDALFLGIYEAWRQSKKKWMSLSWCAMLLGTGVSLVFNTHWDPYHHVLPLHCHGCIRDSRNGGSRQLWWDRMPCWTRQLGL